MIMSKLSLQEKEAILSSLKELHSEEVQVAVALELRHQSQSDKKCSLPVLNDFNCTQHSFECLGCVFNVKERVAKVSSRQGVSGEEGFDEDQLTVRPKGWEHLDYHGRGTPQKSNVIRKHGWCHRCKEKLEECRCHNDIYLIEEDTDV